MYSLKALFVQILAIGLLFGCSGNTTDSTTAEESEDSLIGTWELAYYMTMEAGKIESPNDGKPVYWDLKADGTYEGQAGNNSILGNHRIENGKMIFTYLTTEVARTEWETLFVESLKLNYQDSVYVLPIVQINNELIFNYQNDDTMHFIRRP